MSRQERTPAEEWAQALQQTCARYRRAQRREAVREWVEQFVVATVWMTALCLGVVGAVLAVKMWVGR